MSAIRPSRGDTSTKTIGHDDQSDLASWKGSRRGDRLVSVRTIQRTPELVKRLEERCPDFRIER
jgi:hypothetical protein